MASRCAQKSKLIIFFMTSTPIDHPDRAARQHHAAESDGSKAARCRSGS